MEWICIGFAVLCIAMSCVALWYREKWNESEDKCRALERENRELSTGQKITISDNARMLADNINLQNELISIRERYEQSKFQCDSLREENEKKCEEISMLRDEFKHLHQQLPKRDSKGRYCKKTIV